MDEILLKYALLVSSVIVCGAVLILRAHGMGTKAKSIDSTQRWAPPKPTLGGLLFGLSILVGQLLFKPLSLWQNLALFAAFGIGLIDDLYRIGPKSKMAGQGIAAICLMVFLYQSNMQWPMMLFFGASVFVMMNSINMLDNMDGAATIGSLPYWLMATLLLMVGQTQDALGVYLLVGALSFLIYNAFPSKMFMGDSGSMLLGIASVMVMVDCYNTYAGHWIILIPIWLFVSTLTLADTTLVVIGRWQHGKSPMKGGKDHSTHHLVYHGWSQVKVTYVFLGLALFQALTAFVVVALRCINVWILATMAVYSICWFIFIWRISKANLKSGKFDYTSH